MIACPMCTAPVSAPSLDDLIETYRLRPMEERILRAVWNGKGRAVQTERIFDAMYADDFDGGPSPTRMYRTFRIAAGRLLARIDGSGVTIKSLGYRKGFRIVFEGGDGG
jgi:hypothetical protein